MSQPFAPVAFFVFKQNEDGRGVQINSEPIPSAVSAFAAKASARKANVPTSANPRPSFFVVGEDASGKRDFVSEFDFAKAA